MSKDRERSQEEDDGEPEEAVRARARMTNAVPTTRESGKLNLDRAVFRSCIRIA